MCAAGNPRRRWESRHSQVPRFSQPSSVIDLVSQWPSLDGVRVEWDPEKDRANRAKHGVSFDEVRVLFEGDADYLVFYDEEHSDDEDRFLAIGPIARGVVTAAFTEPREDVVRIIGARMATRTEEDAFYRHAGGKKR